MPHQVTQVWIGGRDLGGVLQSIGTWHVGSIAHLEAKEAVEHADQMGYIGRRIHYAPAIPEGAEAFELTDLGLAKLREWWGDDVADDAARARQWYRNRR